jgi:branched-chain amino acid transport system ATP-binding protein
MLHVQHLSVWYDVTEVLRDVSFSVNERSVVALLGGNGSGKSTLLNALSGLVAPRSGSVRYLGEETAGLGAHVMVRRGVVQVPQGREVFADMSVEDNLELGAASRANLKEIREDIGGVFDLFPALRERRKRAAGSLSGGEQTQLSIGRALMSRAKLLLMDEPSVGLSPRMVDVVIDTILRLRDRGLTILLVEQNVGVAASVAEEAHVLKDGMIAYAGRAKDLINNPEVLASYLGR